MVAFTSDHLWGSIAGTTTGCFKFLTLFIEIAETEIDKFDVVVVIEKKVLWLQVSVDDPKFMDVLDAGEYLSVELASFFFLEFSVLHDVLEKLTAGAIFHDQIQIVIVFNHL